MQAAGCSQAAPDPSSAASKTLSVDIGGSGIKTILLDARGEALTERLRQNTPAPATPEAIINLIQAQAAQQGDFDRVSVGFPGVVRQGVIGSAANLDSRWIGVDLAQSLTQLLGKPVRVANDADVQGLGAVTCQGVELVLTLGTGVGAALFVNGTLVPNLELGHHPFRKGETYEQQLGRSALEGISKKRWNRRLEKAIALLQAIFNYDTLYLGGGETKQINFDLPKNVKIVSNMMGLLGGIALWRD
ncbi:ROK family protein [Pseudanabaena sp. FACHB-2040]|uniref:ROK family protein n=1 Tax=Pseudanabaena sp. FACHB-2040 TaxID=2692859 RepID=UPI0016863162|nr:ROK family protein [Pseudanabaena sp. FACHB-2040]MBD2259996.1 ROK family protein [Pseudanabaena sp. FACHB-2040]